MGYDLWVLPVDGPITFDEASKRLDELRDADVPVPLDDRLRGFVRDLKERFPFDEDRPSGPLAPGEIGFELDEESGSVLLGIPFPFVSRVGSASHEVAERYGLALLDPQVEAVYLPPQYGGEPVDWGSEALEEPPMPSVPGGVGGDAAADPTPEELADIHRELARDLAGVGVEMWSPIGYRITDEIAAELFADPTGLPHSLQTPDLKARLLLDLATGKRRARTAALAQLAGWDADPEVASALRRLLHSDDALERWQAASAMIRQRATDALDDVLEAARRSSPSAGGSFGELLLPAQLALELATIAGPEEVERARSLLSQWRGPTTDKLTRAERKWAAELDELLT